MRLSKTLIAVSSLALATSFAVAANKGFYIGISGIGTMQGFNSGTVTSSGFKYNGHSMTDGITLDRSSKYHFGGEAHIGYLYAYQDDLSFGGQLGYSHYGTVHSTDYSLSGSTAHSSVKENSIDLLLVLDVDITRNSDFFLKGGANYFMINQTGSGTIGGLNFGSTAQGKYNRFTGSIQAGAGINLYKGLNLSIYYNHVFGNNYRDDSNYGDGPVTMDQIGVGLNYYF